VAEEVVVRGGRPGLNLPAAGKARRRAVADVSSVRRERAGEAGEIRSLL
jgi:hypothetical protein